MRTKLFISFALSSLFFFTGCRSNQSDMKAVGESVFPFPPELAGTWRTDDGRWQMTFNPDGSLYSIKYYFNDKPMIISEGGGYDFADDGSVRSVYMFGDYSVSYKPESKLLSVEIAIKNFEITRPGGKLEGQMADKFIGGLSADKKTWTVAWINQTTFKELEIESPPPRQLIFKHIEQAEPEQAH